MANTILIDSVSIIVFFTATVFILYTMVKFLKGMKKPPFWVYLIGGFFLITLHGLLVTFNIKLFSDDAISLIRLIGNFAILVGVVKLYRSYSSRIKYDRTSF